MHKLNQNFSIFWPAYVLRMRISWKLCRKVFLYWIVATNSITVATKLCKSRNQIWDLCF